MSQIPLSASSAADPRLPARHSVDIRQRHPGGPIYGLLACITIIGGFVLFRSVLPPGAILRTPGTSQSRPIKTNDQGLRQLAIKAPVPRYPPASLANNVTGVVVATVTIDKGGRFHSVQIVESPDAATADAVREAVTQWVFRPATVPSPSTLIAGTLIFYFHRDGGRGVVLSSQEMQGLKSAAANIAAENTHPVPRTIDETELRVLTRTVAPIVVDIRSRAMHQTSHRDGAINIPVRELETRGVAELPRSRLIVIDCFAEQQRSGLCDIATHVLSSAGFAQVAIVNRSVH